MDQALVLFPTSQGRRWLRFTDAQYTMVANELAEIPALIAEAEALQAEGKWVVMLLSYDSAAAFDPALVAHRHASAPLLAMGVFAEAQEVDGPQPGSHEVGRWEPTQSEAQHASSVAAVREYLAAGDTYQVNLTTRMRAPFEGSPEGLFARISRAQGAAHAAFVDLGDAAVCSASPELLFRRDGSHIVCRPMKGTAARVADLHDDVAAGARLQLSPKERAENTMIVDMVRNDLGRIARIGSVKVPHLHRVEHYPTVHQMTSAVHAQTDVNLMEVLEALFPGASVTGAPKVRTSQIIAELEPDARGIYCGSIGVLAPGGRQEFNLAIRTVWIDKQAGTAEYGVGGGIVWDSTAGAEWQEVLAKAAVLTTAEPPFALLETMRWDPQGGLANLDDHLQRLQRSARHFSFALDLDRVRDKLNSIAAEAPQRVRMTVDADGEFAVEVSELPAADATTSDGPWRVPLDSEPMRADDIFLAHKTTERLVYNAARLRHFDAPDVILWNEDGNLTETTIGNLVLELDGQLVTPALECGLLAGTERQRALADGRIAEAVVPVADASRATRMWMLNAVRGWTPLELDET